MTEPGGFQSEGTQRPPVRLTELSQSVAELLDFLSESSASLTGVGAGQDESEAKGSQQPSLVAGPLPGGELSPVHKAVQPMPAQANFLLCAVLPEDDKDEACGPKTMPFSLSFALSEGDLQPLTEPVVDSSEAVSPVLVESTDDLPEAFSGPPQVVVGANSGDMLPPRGYESLPAHAFSGVDEPVSQEPISSEARPQFFFVRPVPSVKVEEEAKLCSGYVSKKCCLPGQPVCGNEPDQEPYASQSDCIWPGQRAESSESDRKSHLAGHRPLGMAEPDQSDLFEKPVGCPQPIIALCHSHSESETICSHFRNFSKSCWEECHFFPWMGS